jgi:ABC-type Fe3+ transport system permease subunit
MGQDIMQEKSWRLAAMTLLCCCWCLIDVECGLREKGHNRSSMNIKNNEDDRKSSIRRIWIMLLLLLLAFLMWMCFA